MAMERLANFSDEVTARRASSVRAEEVRVERRDSRRLDRNRNGKLRSDLQMVRRDTVDSC